MSYDSVLSEAIRLTTIFKHQPWARDDFWKMAPEIVAELQTIDDVRISSDYAAQLEDEITDLKEEVYDLKLENDRLQRAKDFLGNVLQELGSELSLKQAAEDDLRNDLAACERALLECRSKRASEAAKAVVKGEGDDV